MCPLGHSPLERHEWVTLQTALGEPLPMSPFCSDGAGVPQAPSLRSCGSWSAALQPCVMGGPEIITQPGREEARETSTDMAQS